MKEPSQEKLDAKTARERALECATRNREMDDSSSGEVQLLRAKRYLAFLLGTAS